MPILILFIFGLAVGSFLNVLIDRLVRDESIISPPSHCDHCKKKLAWYHLLPVASFIALRGRCRYCHKSISWQYPIVELLTGVLFVGIAFRMAVTLPSILYSINTFYYLFIISCLIVIFFADLKYGIIPDKIIFPAVIVSLLYLFLIHNSLFMIHFLSALGGFLFFLAIYLLTRGRGMGFGDVKLAFLLGAIFGFPKIVFVLYIAFLTGAFFSIILIILGKKKLKGAIAFGPFLVIGSLLVWFLGDFLANILWFLP